MYRTQSLIDTWASIPHRVVMEAVDQCRIQLHVCEKSGSRKGHHFKHLLYYKQLNFFETPDGTTKPPLFRATDRKPLPVKPTPKKTLLLVFKVV